LPWIVLFAITAPSRGGVAAGSAGDALLAIAPPLPALALLEMNELARTTIESPA